VIEQLASVPDEGLLAELGTLEAELARLQHRQLQVLAELQSRNVPGQLGLRGLAELITAQLRCSRVEARRRAQAVERFGARRALTGESLEPVYPATADAFADGEIGAAHAAAIADTVEAIPVADRAEHAVQVETALLEHARTVDPRTVRLLGQRSLAHLDPDGPSPVEERLQQSHQRSPGQRMHDAFEEAGRRLLTTGDLPDHAGLPAQLIISLTLTNLERRAGRATTHHGGTLSVADALTLAADGDLLPAILDDTGGILSYGHGRRLASAGQRKALFARDRGCTFPSCTRTAA
jgi:hypothetical protein